MKVLILTANFAPRGASPAVRTVNLVKYISRIGHSVRVVTYDESTLTLFSAADATLSDKVPPEAAVFRVPAGPLRRRLIKRALGSTAKAVTGKGRLIASPLSSLLVPDPHIEALPFFVREATRQIEADAPDVLISHGYPFSMHIAAAWLKRRFPHLRWIADYGDPWSGSPLSELRRPRWREWLDAHLESWALRRADRVAVTSEPTRQLYERLFPFLGGRIHVAPMGFDPEDFAAIPPHSRTEAERGEFWLVHTGRLYSEARDPRTFIRALNTLRSRVDDARRLRVFLVGEVEAALRSEITGSPVKDMFTLVPWVPVSESIAWMKAADCLLLFGNRESVQVPGKVYQYVGTGRAILMLSLFDHDPTGPIALHNPGSLVVPNDEAQITEALRDLLARGPPPTSGIAAAEQYGWPHIARTFLAGLDIAELRR